MIGISAEEIAAAAGAEIVSRGGAGHPDRALIDSRDAGPGDLFFGLPGATADGGEFAAGAIQAGAWGVVVEPDRAAGLEATAGLEGTDDVGGAWVFAAEHPLGALGAVARAWRRALGARVIGITGSVGKTSVKDIAGALMPGTVHASPENFNTEIGLPLTILSASAGVDILVLEMAMRGPGQIAELAEIAEPDVAVITNVGPVHIELLGSVEAIAAVKAEVLDHLPPDGAAVAPVDSGVLEPHLAAAPRVIRFGAGGDVAAETSLVAGEEMEAMIVAGEEREAFMFPFTEAHNLTNALAAIGAGRGLGASLAEMSRRTARIGFSSLRGERIGLSGGGVLVNDCYNANPVSMRAALDHLASLEADRRIAILGAMAELGPEAAAYHRGIGRYARDRGIDTVIGVGEDSQAYDPDDLVATPEEAAELLAAQLAGREAVLVKGSRSAGLEAVAETLADLDVVVANG